MAQVRPLALVGMLALGLGACGSDATSAYLRVPRAEPPQAETRVARLVGELLGADPERSAAAERGLLALDGTDLAELERHATRIPAERDPRWLHVLDEQRLGPSLAPEERVAFLLWKSARPEPFFQMKARAALTEQARQDPRPLLAALAAGTPGGSALAVALALAERRDAVPALLERYVASEDEDERRALSEAVRSLLGEEVRLRVGASREDREREAGQVRQRFLLGRDVPAPTPEGGAHG